MNDNYVIHDGQLYHHGIKGMKWGIRRFQNPDGSLTPAGRKRYDDGEGDTWKARFEAKRKARAQEKINNAYRKKSVSDMTDEELAAATKRAKLEREHRAVRPDDWKTPSEAKADAAAGKSGKDTGHKIHRKSVDNMTTEEIVAAIERARLEDTYRSLRPPEVSRGQKFAESVKSIATKIAEDEGKKFLGKLGDKILDKYFPGMKEDLDAVKKQVDIDKVKADIDKVKADAEKVRAEADKTRSEASKTVDTTLDDAKKQADIDKTKAETREINAKTATAAQNARKLKMDNDERSKKPGNEESDPNPPKDDPDPPTGGSKPKNASAPPKDEPTYKKLQPGDKNPGYGNFDISDIPSKAKVETVTNSDSDVSAGETFVSVRRGLTISELLRQQWDKD